MKNKGNVMLNYANKVWIWWPLKFCVCSFIDACMVAISLLFLPISKGRRDVFEGT